MNSWDGEEKLETIRKYMEESERGGYGSQSLKMTPTHPTCNGVVPH